MTSKRLYKRVASTDKEAAARRRSEPRIFWSFNEKAVDKQTLCGYIPNMKDRAREKNSMVHVRFTEPERRKMKAVCALEGISMQQYIRSLALQDLKKRKGKAKL